MPVRPHRRCRCHDRSCGARSGRTCTRWWSRSTMCGGRGMWRKTPCNAKVAASGFARCENSLRSSGRFPPGSLLVASLSFKCWRTGRRPQVLAKGGYRPVGVPMILVVSKALAWRRWRAVCPCYHGEGESILRSAISSACKLQQLPAHEELVYSGRREGYLQGAPMFPMIFNTLCGLYPCRGFALLFLFM